MSNFRRLRNYSNEDFIAPIVRLIVMSKKEVLLNKIVSKKSSLSDILKQEGLKGKEFTLFGKVLNLNDKIIDIIPKNYNSLSNIELIIEETNLSIDNTNIYYERLLKPYEKPFRILVFTPSEFDVSIKTYPNETIKLFQLDNYSENLCTYCNTPKDLYISGGKEKNFWRINSIKTSIEKLKDLPMVKENHSMIYIPKRYIYFIGGNNKNTFYYDEIFETFTSWAEMNKQVNKPALILVNSTYIYSFGNQNKNSKNDFIERTNLKNNNPFWETIFLRENILFPNENFSAAISDDNEIYFLGGRKNRGEKIYKFNLSTQKIEKGRQENTSLTPVDKNFYPLNEFNCAMIPDTKINEEIKVVIFNKKRKKYRKVVYEKNLDENINNYNLDQDDSLIIENNQIKIVWKEFQNNYISIDNVPDTMLYLPSIEDLKKVAYEAYDKDYDINELAPKDYITEENETNIDNIYQNERPNVLRKGGMGRNNNNIKNSDENNKKLPTFGNPDDFIKSSKQKDNALSQNQMENGETENDMKLLNEKIISSKNEEKDNNKNKINIIYPNTLKELFNGDVSDEINLNRKFLNFKPLKEEYFSGRNNGDNTNEDMKFTPGKSEINLSSNTPEINYNDMNATPLKDQEIIDELNQYKNNDNIEFNQKEIPIDNNRSINFQGYDLEKLNEYNPMTLKGIFYGDVDQDINLKLIKPEIKQSKYEIIKGEIKGKGRNSSDGETNPTYKKKTVLRQSSKHDNMKPVIQYGQTVGFKRPNIRKGKDFEHVQRFSIRGEIEGKPLETIEYTLKGIFDEDINQNIPILKKRNYEITRDNNENPIIGIKKGKMLSDMISSNASDDKNEIIEGNIPGLIGSVNAKGQKLRGPKEEKRGNIPSFDSNVNIQGPKMNIEKQIMSDEFNPKTLRDLFNGDVNDKVHLNTTKISLPEHQLESISGYIQGKMPSQNIDIKEPNININGPKLRNTGKKGNLNGSVNINTPKLEGEMIEGNIPGLGKSINVNGPNIDFQSKQSFRSEIIPGSLKGEFSGDINDEIKLNKVDERLKLFPTESISGNIEGTPYIKYMVEYGGSKGYVRPKIKKGKDFEHSPNITIAGTIEGNKKFPPTLKNLFGGDINENIALNNNLLKIPKFNIEEDIAGINSMINEPSLKASGINSSININNPNINGELIEGNIPGIGGSVNINGPELNQDYDPNTLKGLFNGDIDDRVYLNRTNIKLPEYQLENISGYIQGKKPSTNIEINGPSIDMSGQKIRAPGRKGNLNGSIDINEPKLEGEMIEGNIPGLGKSNINGPNIDLQSKISNRSDIIPYSLKGEFSGDINDEIKLNKVDARLKLFPTESISGNIEGSPSINYVVEYGDTKGYKRPKIKKGKDFNHVPDIAITGTIEGNKPPSPTLKDICGQDINSNIHLNKLKLPELKLEDQYFSRSIKGPSLNGELIEGNVPGINRSINIKGSNMNINEYNPNTLKGLFNGDVNDEVHLNRKEIKLPEYQLENISGYIQGSHNIDINGPRIDINGQKLRAPGKKGNLNGPQLEGEMIEGNIPGIGKSIDINGPNIDIKSIKSIRTDIIPNSLKGEFSGDINDEIKLNKVNDRLKLFPTESISGNIEGTPSINYVIEYGSTKGYKRPKIKKGKDFNHIPDIVITGTIKGNKSPSPTLKDICGQDINSNIHLNKLKMPELKLEEIEGFINGKKSVKGPSINGELIEGNIPGINRSINIKGSNMNINGYDPYTLRGLFNGDVNDEVHLNRDEIKLPEYQFENISGYIQGSHNFDINGPSIDINGQKLRNAGKKGNLKGSVDINGPKLEGELIEGNIPGLGKSININGPNIDLQSKISNRSDIIPYSLKGEFSGDINDEIKLNKVDARLKLFPTESISGNIEGSPSINYVVEYGDTKGYKRPKIKKGKDFNHVPDIAITGTIEGNKPPSPTLKDICGQDINSNIHLNKLKLPELKLEDQYFSRSIKGPSLNGELIEGNVPGINRSINIKGSNMNINEYNPNTLKGLFNGDVNDEVHLNRKEIKLPEYQLENISGYIQGSHNIDINGPRIDINGQKLRAPGKKGNLNGPQLEGEMIEGNIPGIGKSIDINGPNIDIKSIKSIRTDIIPNSLKGEFSGDINDEIKLNKVNDRLKLFPTESISGNIEGTPSINYVVEYGSTKGYKRPKIKKGKDFNHFPDIVITGTIKGNKTPSPTLKEICGQDINSNINLNKLKMPELKLEDIEGFINGNINNNLKGSIKDPSINGELIEGNIPGINRSLNIKGPNVNISGYEPYTLRGLFNGDVNDAVHLNRANIKLPEYQLENISGFIKGSHNFDINDPSIDINGPKLRAGGKKRNLKGSVNIDGPKLEGEMIEGNIPGLEKSININGPNIDLQSKISNRSDIIPNSLKGEFSGDINDIIKLNKVNDRLKLFPTESISGNIKGAPAINYIVEYGSTKGYTRPKIKKGKDFRHVPDIIITGIISGSKTHSPTLKNICGQDINSNIHLNKIKMPILKDEQVNIEGYTKRKESDEGNYTYSGPITEEEIIKGSIPGTKRNDDNKSQKSKGSKMNKKDGNIPVASGKINVKDSNIMKNEYEYDPLTLRGLFNGDVNNKIILNQSDFKLPGYKLDNISGYIKGQPSENFEIKVPNINIKGPKLKSNKKNIINNNERSINFNGNNFEGEIIEGNISGKGKSININVPNVNVQSMIGNNNQNTIRDLFSGDVNENIKLNKNLFRSSKFKIEQSPSYKPGKKTQQFIKINMPNYNISQHEMNSQEKIEGSIPGIVLSASGMKNKYGFEPQTLKQLCSCDIKDDIQKLKIRKYRIEKNNYENISGLLKGSKYDKNEKISIQSNPNKQSHKISQLKRSERINFIEYGATQGYMRPNIRKGIDFEHKPKVNFDKYESNSSINVFSKPFVVDDKKIATSAKIKFK